MVDSVTAGIARDLVQFEKLGMISMKGKAVQAEVYTPLGPAAASVRLVRLHNLEPTRASAGCPSLGTIFRSPTAQNTAFRDD